MTAAPRSTGGMEVWAPGVPPALASACAGRAADVDRRDSPHSCCSPKLNQDAWIATAGLSVWSP